MSNATVADMVKGQKFSDLNRIELMQLNRTGVLLNELSVKRFFLQDMDTDSPIIVEKTLLGNEDWKIGRKWPLKDVTIMLPDALAALDEKSKDSYFHLWPCAKAVDSLAKHFLGKPWYISAGICDGDPDSVILYVKHKNDTELWPVIDRLETNHQVKIGVRTVKGFVPA